jgi:membrane associated rhomboid family serine protease
MTDFRPGRFQVLPMVVKNLIIINVLVFLLQNLLTMRGIINVDDYFALHSWQSAKFRWWQMFTHMFMHGSIAHIFFNMFALWMFGRILENVWGPRRFLVFYLVCGLGAALCHLGVLSFEFTRFYNAFMDYQQHPSLNAFLDFIDRHKVPVDKSSLSPWYADPDSPARIRDSVSFLYKYYNEITDQATVGASGAVFGLLFAFGYLFPNTELFLYFIPIPIKAKWFVTGYALLELFQGIENSAGDNIAHFAHLGGLLFAFILLRIWRSKFRDRFY